MEKQKIDKTEAKKKLDKVCFQCFILDIILVFLITFISILLDEFYLGTVISFFLVLALFLMPIIDAIKLRVFSFALLANLIITFILFFLILLATIDGGGAREAAQAARIKSAMDQFSYNAETYKLANGGYGVPLNINMATREKCKDVPYSLISKGSDGKALCDDIQSQKDGGELIIYSNTTAYCIQKKLPGGLEGKWCVDSKGNEGSTYAECNLNNFSCKK